MSISLANASAAVAGVDAGRNSCTSRWGSYTSGNELRLDSSPLYRDFDGQATVTNYRSACLSKPSKPTAPSKEESASTHDEYKKSPHLVPSTLTTNLGGATMSPTWKGFIHTTRDGLVLLEACLQGILSHIPRRPHDRERQGIISSGNILVYEENASGIRRWTDGITWSPSRIMGNFLVYRELLDGHPPGEKKRAAKKRKRGSEDLTTPIDTNVKTEEDRQLIGSLSLESYNFKPGGLAKKTLSVEVRGVRHHIISYYRIEDIKNAMYRRPTQCDYLKDLEPRVELLDNSGFKSPVENKDDKIPQVVSPKSQVRPIHHMQLVNARVPVVVNVPSQSGQMPSSLPPTLTHSDDPSIMYQQSSIQYQIPANPIDGLDIDTMPQHQRTSVSQMLRHQYSLPRRHTSSQTGTTITDSTQHHHQQQQQQQQPQRSISHTIPIPQQSLREDKRVRHAMHPHLHPDLNLNLSLGPSTPPASHSQMFFEPNTIAHENEYNLSSNSSASTTSKYMENWFHTNYSQHELMHLPMYMPMQGQSYTR